MELRQVEDEISVYEREGFGLQVQSSPKREAIVSRFGSTCKLFLLSDPNLSER